LDNHDGTEKPKNLLAGRLKRLEAAGLTGKSAYQEHPVRYA